MKIGSARAAAFAAIWLCGFSAAAQNMVPSVPVPNGPSRPSFSRVPGAQSSPAGQAAPYSAAAGIPAQLINNTEAAIDQQTKGQFPTMERGPSLPLGTLQRSWDRPSAASGQTAPGVVHYLWHPDFIMGVRTRDFMVTTLLLPNWEKANEFYLGDPVVFEAKKVRPNVIAVRSRNAGADSNLTVLGASGAVYNFYLRSETWNSTQISDLTVYVDAARPNDGAETAGRAAGEGASEDSAAQAAAMPDFLRRVLFRPEDLKFDMKMYARRESDAEIAPERVFEDGVFTYFDFGDRGDSVNRPIVHQVVDGVDTTVNTRTAGAKSNILIAEAVGDFILRSGNRVVCVRRLGPRTIPASVEIGTGMPEAGAATAGDTAGRRVGGREP